MEYKSNIHCWDFHGLLIAKSISSCEIKIIYIPFREEFLLKRWCTEDYGPKAIFFIYIRLDTNIIQVKYI